MPQSLAQGNAVLHPAGDPGTAVKHPSATEDWQAAVRDVKNRLLEIEASVLFKPKFVLDGRSGMWHMVKDWSCAIAQAEWAAVCGWKFGATVHTLSVEKPQGEPTCERCFPRPAGSSSPSSASLRSSANSSTSS